MSGRSRVFPLGLLAVIILAQAFNGLLLPFAAVFLWLTMNDRELLGDRGANSRAQNVVLGAVVAVCLALGTRGVMAAVGSALAYLG